MRQLNIKIIAAATDDQIYCLLVTVKLPAAFIKFDSDGNESYSRTNRMRSNVTAVESIDKKFSDNKRKIPTLSAIFLAL